MDLTRFKPGQLKCVTTLDAPLVVSAGAGSGKTFTLTQRIAWALMEGSAPDGGAFLDGIEQVMAITFTDKAAGEIKSRVKSTLRAEGMAEEALKVDDAWISTIHGMCSRILRTHAVELGIDPAFKVLDPALSDEMMRESVQAALSSTTEFVAPEGLDALFAEYSGRSMGGFGFDSIEDMVLSMVHTASSSPCGMDCFNKPPACHGASELVRSALVLIEDLRETVLTQKESASRDTWLQKADEFVEKAMRRLSRGDMSAKGALALFGSYPWPAASFGSKEYKELAKGAQAASALVIQELRYALAEPLLDDLLKLASAVLSSYRQAKKEQGALDNDDLLIKAAQALSDHPDIAQEYANKFKLIMVDEFQDTDQLQVDMIKRMAGPGACRLCTVGDAQQSIYRFRGADVQVYRNHLANVVGSNPDGLIELPDNFRSHGDVLKLVDRIFEQPHVFGSEFMSLSASRSESSVKRPFLGGSRRVDILLTTYPARKGIDQRDITLFEARRIARRFSELRACGHAAGDMVVLLGRMTKAGVFAQALREEGFACVIAGGSIFASAPEVRIMQRLAEVIANPHATAALFEVLSSDMFVLSADDFIALSTCVDESTGVLRRRGIDRGFRVMANAFCAAEGEDVGTEEPCDAQAAEDSSSACDDWFSGANASAGLVHAVRIMSAVAADAGKKPVSEIMEYVVRESGWLSRLEALGAEGQSVAGNVLKAIRLVESIESAGAEGPASVARAMASHIAIAKEAPGALSAQGGDFVRIMTVHASKGLEFPIVAVAEMSGSQARSTAFSCASIEGCAYVNLRPKKSVSNLAPSSAVAKATSKAYRFVPCDDSMQGDIREAVDRAETPMEQYELLRAYTEEQELQERRRLLYVGLTRAKEALIVAMTSARPSSDASESGIDAASGIYDDIRSALFGFEDFPQGETSVDFGGSAPALVSRVDTDESDFEQLQDAAPAIEDASTHEIAVPLIEEPALLREVRLASFRDDVASYSSLADASGIEQVSSECLAGRDGAAALSDDDIFWDELGSSLLHDADKATDVGTAFHMLAQQAVQLRRDPKGLLVRPSNARIAAVMRTCGLDDSARSRIESALDLWFSSEIAQRCEQAENLTAELPFFIDLKPEARAGDSVVSRGGIRYLEGSMDLFATCISSDGEPEGRALIVDYKTGGSPSETVDDLYAKHLLQASCYAYVALMRGYTEVEALFVRVEQLDPLRNGQPQVVRYAFGRDSLGGLRKRIEEACARLHGKRFG